MSYTFPLDGFPIQEIYYQVYVLVQSKLRFTDNSVIMSVNQSDKYRVFIKATCSLNYIIVSEYKNKHMLWT